MDPVQTERESLFGAKINKYILKNSPAATFTRMTLQGEDVLSFCLNTPDMII